MKRSGNIKKDNNYNVEKTFRVVTFQEMLTPSLGNVNDYLTRMYVRQSLALPEDGTIIYRNVAALKTFVHDMINGYGMDVL